MKIAYPFLHFALIFWDANNRIMLDTEELGTLGYDIIFNVWNSI